MPRSKTKEPRIVEAVGRTSENIGVKIQLAVSLLDQLKAAAKRHGNSFNAEAANRLSKSFAEEEAFGGEDGRRLLYLVTAAFVLAGKAAAGNREISQWITNPKAYAAGMFGVLEALLIAQPGVSFETCNSQIESIRGRIATRLLAK
jgi:hypothetical protein